MKIRHARFDDQYAPPIEDTFQMLRLTCPLCNKAVQFAIQEEDKLHKEKNEYLEWKQVKMLEEITRLKLTLDKLLKK